MVSQSCNPAEADHVKWMNGKDFSVGRYPVKSNIDRELTWIRHSRCR